MRYSRFNIPSRPPLPTPPKKETNQMSRSAGPVHTLSGYISGETDKAILFDLVKISGDELDQDHEHRKKHWFPLSQVSKIIRQPKGSIGLDDIIVSEWILKQKELI